MQYPGFDFEHEKEEEARTTGRRPMIEVLNLQSRYRVDRRKFVRGSSRPCWPRSTVPMIPDITLALVGTRTITRAQPEVPEKGRADRRPELPRVDRGRRPGNLTSATSSSRCRRPSGSASPRRTGWRPSSSTSPSTASCTWPGSTTGRGSRRRRSRRVREALDEGSLKNDGGLLVVGRPGRSLPRSPSCSRSFTPR